MAEQACPKCGEIAESEDLDKPADMYCCWECGHSWCDIESWSNRWASHADNMRKVEKENG